MTIGVGVAVAFWAKADVVEPMRISSAMARVATVRASRTIRENLTPNPFPSGKGNRIGGSSPFLNRKRNRIVVSSPFRCGKGDNRARSSILTA
jgi:hypothetical protein